MSQWNFDKVKRQLEQTKRVLPVRLAKQAENHFTESFTKGALDEHKWKEVNRRIEGTYEYKYPKKKGLSRRTSPILVRTGNLRRKVSRSMANATWDGVRLVVDLPYAKAQNEGTDDIPARPYMKQTNTLAKKQVDLINNEMDKIWK